MSFTVSYQHMVLPDKCKGKATFFDYSSSIIKIYFKAL